MLLLIVLRTQALVQFDQIIAHLRLVLSFERLFSNMNLLLPLKPEHLLGRVFQSLLLVSDRFQVKGWRLLVAPFSYFGLLVSQVDAFDSVLEIQGVFVAEFVVICVI